jgi:hypothetical protein
MDRLELPDRQQPAPYTGLIGDHYEPNALLAQRPQPLRGSWQEFEPVWSCKVMPVDNDGPITVEDYDRRRCGSGAHAGSLEAARLSVSVVL